jgi:release factor glutamine methyltransferase
MKTSSSITNKIWLSVATAKLLNSGIDSAQIDSLIILCYSLHVSKLEILANPNVLVPAAKERIANKILDRRIDGYPIAYTTKDIEFYGRSFYVDRRTLIPRPESESFINLLKTSDLKDVKQLTDVGCGSGILGITAKIEIPKLKVELVDKYTKALEVAILNLKKFKIATRPIQSNLLTNSNKKYDIILANLPYIPKDMPINFAAKFEPKNAIFSGYDGLDLYRMLAKQIAQFNKYPKYILIECLDNQLKEISNIFLALGYTLCRSEFLVHQFIR